MKYTVIITDTSPQFGGETSVVCFSRKEAIIKARKECLEARAIGIKCYAKVMPKKAHIKREFERLGWL